MTSDAAIIATAGHVDHGKSSLVQLLTGLDPDTLDVEQQRGLTIELGHQSLDLAGVGRVSLIDAPGHEDYLGTTIAGLYAATAVALVVSADEGWSAQTEQHLAAIAALGHDRVALIVSKTDRADPASVLADGLARLRRVGISPLAHACVSAKARIGIPELTSALSALTGRSRFSHTPVGSARLWVDRSFTLRGIGTVVTGTLHEGEVVVGDHLTTGGPALRVRGMHRHGNQVSGVSGPARVALNLAGVSASNVPRGALLTTLAEPTTSQLSGPLRPAAAPPRRWPRELLVSVGSSTVAAGLTVREGRAHLRLPRPRAVRCGDTLLLREPGGREVLAGVDIDRIGPVSGRRSTSPDTKAPILIAATGEAQLLEHLRWHPFQPATEPQRQEWGITGATLRRLGAEGQILYLGEGLALSPTVVEDAWAAIDALDQPFTPGQARACWGTSRRAALALLAYLGECRRVARHDQQGWYTVAGYTSLRG